MALWTFTRKSINSLTIKYLRFSYPLYKVLSQNAVVEHNFDQDVKIGRVSQARFEMTLIIASRGSNYPHIRYET